MPCALLLCPPRDSLFLKDPKHTSHCTGFWRPLCWLKTCLLAWCRRENPFKQIEQRCLRVPSPDTMYSSATKPSDSPERPREVKILSKETLCVPFIPIFYYVKSVQTRCRRMLFQMFPIRISGLWDKATNITGDPGNFSLNMSGLNMRFGVASHCKRFPAN